MSAASIEEAERQVKDGKPTASAWRPEPGDLAWRLVNLDDSLWIVDTMFGKRPTGTLRLQGEEFTGANAKEVQARLHRQKKELADELESIEVPDARGKYALQVGERDECGVSKSARSATLLKPVRIVQNEHEIEFEGEGLKGCGVVAGDVIVLKTPCGGTSPYRLIGKATDSGIEITTWDTSSDKHCLLGKLTRATGPR